MSQERPYWIPLGVESKELPEGMRDACKEILEPVYRDLVMGAETGLEKSSGMTLAFLTWVELVEQNNLACHVNHREGGILHAEEFRDAVDRMLRLSNSKNKVAHVLTRLQELRLKYLGHLNLGHPPDQRETE